MFSPTSTVSELEIGSSRFYSPASLLHHLQESMHKIEEESETLHQQLLDREIDLTTFTHKYKRLRKLYHKRSLTHLATNTSLMG
ncbi:hypothetical protein L1887_23665 [Cichorium endivia]|nr:hypothetical protein L1887_23665 [Cichorium endivia]